MRRRRRRREEGGMNEGILLKQNLRLVMRKTYVPPRGRKSGETN